jgi:hypothetical protein
MGIRGASKHEQGVKRKHGWRYRYRGDGYTVSTESCFDYRCYFKMSSRVSSIRRYPFFLERDENCYPGSVTLFPLFRYSTHSK